jgi:hypothetical protein
MMAISYPQRKACKGKFHSGCSDMVDASHGVPRSFVEAASALQLSLCLALSLCARALGSGKVLGGRSSSGSLRRSQSFQGEDSTILMTVA